ncbi:unnamed protein product, partial [Aureobasidium mustum]
SGWDEPAAVDTAGWVDSTAAAATDAEYSGIDPEMISKHDGECAEATCKRCSGTGHTAAACTEKYKVYPDGLPAAENADKAWDNLMAADTDGDVDDFVQAFWVYCKLAPELTLVQLEECFRETGFKFYLIAKEQTVPSLVHTNVDLQGNDGKKYRVSFQKTFKPRRAILAEGWPKTPEENLQRLQDAGFSLDNLKPYCTNCEKSGHSTKACPEEKQVVEKPKVTCSNCNEDASDCTNERVMVCRNCNTPGHAARDCPEETNMIDNDNKQDGDIAFEYSFHHSPGPDVVVRAAGMLDSCYTTSVSLPKTQCFKSFR